MSFALSRWNRKWRGLNKEQLGQSAGSHRDWLDEIFGVFDHDPVYEEAMRLGREYRESLRPKPAKRGKRQ